ncbi:MAG: hypothetical protein RLZZ241_127 [Bacteroidota bacterium]|jgi:4-deoxy-L-threo-5-hexosulose-uronate ketol-isomerase
MSNYELRYASHPESVKQYNTQALRDEFLIEQVFTEDSLRWTYSHYDRYMVSGVIPVHKIINLEVIDPLKASFFLERRELGVINIGGPGIITVDGVEFSIDHKEALYVGMGKKIVTFKSNSPANPAKFYLNSASAHQAYPVKKIGLTDVEVIELGAPETANARTLRKYIVNSTVSVCQLQMGMTTLKQGSSWNTMPAHVHDRRMEVYLYFEVPQDHAVCHFMGQPQETRHLWVSNEQAVISPPWSIHSGSGTAGYSFIWGMAGENLDYGDMDVCNINKLR